MPLPDRLLLGVGTGAGDAAAGNHAHSGAYEALNPDALETGESTILRGNATGQVTMTSGILRIAYFTARKSETVTQVRVGTSATAAGATPTLVRIGLWTADLDGALLAQVGATPNDTTLLAGTFTNYTKALSTSFVKTAGVRYAVGLLVVTAAAAPTVAGTPGIQASVENSIIRPVLSSMKSAQADLPATLAAGALEQLTNRLYVAILP